RRHCASSVGRWWWGSVVTLRLPHPTACMDSLDTKEEMHEAPAIVFPGGLDTARGGQAQRRGRPAGVEETRRLLDADQDGDQRQVAAGKRQARAEDDYQGRQDHVRRQGRTEGGEAR